MRNAFSAPRRQRQSSAILKRLQQVDKKKLWKSALIVIILITAMALHMVRSNTDSVELEESSAADAAAEDTAEAVFYVDISGAIQNPGVYEVDQETRLFELIEMAGGFAENADLDAVNQADFLEDGQKVIIPLQSGASGGESASGSASGTVSSALININTASKEELMELPGVGSVIADRIIDYRSETRFRKTEDLKEVKGIGDATYEKLKDQISV